MCYSPLIYSDEIRILILQPGKESDGLRASLRHIRLPSSENSHATNLPWNYDFERISKVVYKKKPKRIEFEKVEETSSVFRCDRAPYQANEYDALSYAWGDPTKTHTIHVNGETTGIGANLHTVLLRLRCRDAPRVVWVDAICIDQGNVKERNHQVHMMQRIYASASSVIVSLGDVTANGLRALELAIRLFGPRDSGAPNRLLGYPEADLQGISHLFMKPWWKRIWIVQEVVAARQIVVWCGPKVIPWDCLAHLCNEIRVQEFQPSPKAAFLHSSQYQNFSALDNFRKNRTMPLSHLLQCTRGYQATDPRDKLYALLGMASDVSYDELVPDYTQSVKSVYLNLVSFMVSRLHNLDVISSGRLSSQIGTTPSWLPDWRVSQDLKPLNSEELEGHYYKAAGHTSSVVDMTVFPSTLKIEGIVADTVDLFGGTVSLAHESLSTIRRWHYITKQNINVNCSVRNLFWQTIIAGKDNMGRRASPVFGEHFDTFMRGPAVDFLLQKEGAWA
ncbi:hypothetical protein PG984_013580 [Apiospora sp. TS-2023a]